MKSLQNLTIVAALALPLLASAQTSPAVTPADQPRSNLEKQQTTDNGNAPKYGGPGTDTGGSPAKSSGATDKSKSSKATRSDTAKSNKTAPGDAPTYPAPAPDGTPTK